MNYLAHAFLSFNNPQILVGNMVADFVKGAKKFNYPLQVQHGMQLHRAIDAFTDAHTITKQIKQVFVPTYRLYAGAFLDICYDHFLATHFNNYSNMPLLKFTENTYQILNNNAKNLPLLFSKILPYMQSQNWLYNYKYKWGIQKSFEGLKHRAKYITETVTAYQLFTVHYNLLQTGFVAFFDDLYKFTEQEYLKIS